MHVHTRSTPAFVTSYIHDTTYVYMIYDLYTPYTTYTWYTRHTTYHGMDRYGPDKSR